jgi:hypothetical protein
VPTVVAWYPAVVLITGFCCGDLGGVLNPVLYRSLLSPTSGSSSARLFP